MNTLRTMHFCEMQQTAGTLPRSTDAGLTVHTATAAEGCLLQLQTPRPVQVFCCFCRAPIGVTARTEQGAVQLQMQEPKYTIIITYEDTCTTEDMKVDTSRVHIT